MTKSMKSTNPANTTETDPKQALWDILMNVEPNLYEFKHQWDLAQQDYAKDMERKKVVFNDSRAGTGKTSIAIHKALAMLIRGEVACIHYVRFPDKRSDQPGALPGTLEEKTEPYMQPFYEILYNVGLNPETILEMKKNGLIRTSTTAFVRGATWESTFMIADEAQNATIEDLRLVMTRLHDKGKGVIIGHSGQIDNKLKRYGNDQLNPFEVFRQHMCKKAFAVAHFLHHDYRGEISRWADEIYTTIDEIEETPRVTSVS